MSDLPAILSKLPPAVAQLLESFLRRVPVLRRQLDRQYDALIDDLAASLHPYQGKLPAYTHLPRQGRTRADILADLAALCRGGAAGRTSPGEITLFKSVGSAIEDLAAAALVWEDARP